LKPRVTSDFELPEGGRAPRASFQDVPTFHKRIFGRVRKCMGDAAANQILIPGVNAYNYGKYAKALRQFEQAIERVPAIEEELYPHLVICRRVLNVKKDDKDGQYEGQLRRWKAVPSLLRWVVRKPFWWIRCKYCGHYTSYIDPMQGFAYLGTNNCELCKRGYATPDFVWDSIDG
jgi:hypothetical protein